MCEECHRVTCDASCPFAVGSESHICEVCGEVLFADEDCFVRADHFVCADCAENLTLDELLTLAELRDVSDLLEVFGFRRFL